MDKESINKKNLGIVRLILSTLAAAIGVQSKKNLEADFQQKSALPFIAAGIVFTILFVVLLVGVVKIVLAN